MAVMQKLEIIIILNDTFWFCIIERVTRVDWFFSVICHNEEWDGKLGTLY